jgi:hypothetical protein
MQENIRSLKAADAVRIAESLAALRGFPRGANRAAALAAVAIALIEDRLDPVGAKEAVLAFQPRRWTGVQDFRAYVTSRRPKAIEPASYKGFLLPNGNYGKDEIDRVLRAVDEVAESAIESLSLSEREQLEQAAGCIPEDSPATSRRRMVACWLDRHEMRHARNPQPLPLDRF